jgi:hypothetical protein
MLRDGNTWSGNMDFFGECKPVRYDLGGGSGEVTLSNMTFADFTALVRIVDQPAGVVDVSGVPVSGRMSAIQRECVEAMDHRRTTIAVPSAASVGSPVALDESAFAPKATPAAPTSQKAPSIQKGAAKPAPKPQKAEPSEKKKPTPARKRGSGKASPKPKAEPAKKVVVEKPKPSEKKEVAPASTPHPVENPVKEKKVEPAKVETPAPASKKVEEAPKVKPKAEPSPAKEAIAEPEKVPEKAEPKPEPKLEPATEVVKDDTAPTVDDGEDQVFETDFLEDNDGFENPNETTGGNKPSKEAIIEALSGAGNIRSIVSTLYDMGFRTKDKIVAISVEIKKDVKVLSRINDITGRIARACRLVNIE